MKKQMGRTMVKWQPFASLPTQYEGIRDLIEEKNKLPRPILSDDQKEEISRVLQEALETQKTVHFTYYKNGMHLNEMGEIHKIDLHTNTIVFIDVFSYQNIHKFEDIIDVRFA